MHPRCRTFTLTDEPEEIDSFFGPHQRIADAVAELIQPADAKGISIGIEGSWCLTRYLVESSFRQNFQDYLYNQIKSESELPGWFFALFGIELKTQLLRSSRGEKVVELFSSILNRRHQSGLAWLQDTLSEARPNLEKYFNERAWTEFCKH